MMFQTLSFVVPALGFFSWLALAFFQYKLARKWSHKNSWMAFVPILNVFQLFQLTRLPFWHIFIPILQIITIVRVHGRLCRLNGERAIFQVYLYVPFLQIWAMWKLVRNHTIFIKDADQRESVATLENAIKNNVPTEQIHATAQAAGMTDRDLQKFYHLARIGVKNNLKVVGEVKPTYLPEVVLVLGFVSPWVVMLLLGTFLTVMLQSLLGGGTETEFAHALDPVLIESVETSGNLDESGDELYTDDRDFVVTDLQLAEPIVTINDQNLTVYAAYTADESVAKYITAIKGVRINETILEDVTFAPTSLGGVMSAFPGREMEMRAQVVLDEASGTTIVQSIIPITTLTEIVYSGGAADTFSLQVVYTLSVENTPEAISPPTLVAIPMSMLPDRDSSSENIEETEESQTQSATGLSARIEANSTTPTQVSTDQSSEPIRLSSRIESVIPESEPETRPRPRPRPRTTSADESSSMTTPPPSSDSPPLSSRIE